MIAQDFVPQNEANTNHNVEGTFKCTLCDRAPFARQVGLSQHIRQIHPEVYNRSINVDRVKPRWSGEETDRMARMEAIARRDGKTKNMNVYLLALFPDRTLDSIKGKRKKEDYKERVIHFDSVIGRGDEDDESIAQDQNEAIQEPIISGDNEFLKTQILDLVASLDNNTLKSTRDLVGYARDITSGTSLEPGFLAKWLKQIFKHAKSPRGPCYNRRVIEDNIGNKKRRRQEYAILQKLFVKDFGGAVRQVLSDGDQQVNMPSTEEVVAFWKRIFEQESEGLGAEANIAFEENALLRGVWDPISVDDVLACELDLDSAAGPDGIKVANWRGIGVRVRALFLNLILYNESLDDELRRARTVLIPKGTGDITPSNTRPLSITSVVVRHLHKILAKRFKKLHSFDPCQRAFIDCDGTMENLSIISTVLADARMSKREVRIATLDLRKAFDSVSHRAIVDTITSLGFPRPFINYIKSLYTDSRTTLQYNNVNTELKVKQGVLQGDPISPLLFNAVLDQAIKLIPGEVGYRINDKIISCVAYADDLILISSTRDGLQSSLDAVTTSLASFGLRINAEKSSTLSLVPSGKDKKMKVIEESLFEIDGSTLRAIGVIDTWKYLGIHFKGSKVLDKDICLASDLDKITKAPLKPYQRLRVLCGAVIPKYMHSLVLGRVGTGQLRNMDLMIRSHVKRWLYFPKDLPTAYIYARVRDGGLGITNLSVQVPLVKKLRLQRFLTQENDTAKAIKHSFYIKRQLDWCDSRLEHIGNDVSKSRVSQYWRNVLYGMVDTSDLKDACKDTSSNSWVVDQAHEISGMEYIHYHHVRAGSLPSKARLARGSERERLCRAGCLVSETNYHIVQQCQRTHGGRIFRHDRIVDMLYSHLNSRADCKVVKEPRFKTELGLRKPDLLISEGNKTIVLDVQIVGGRDMKRDYLQKCNKYREIRGFETLVKRKCFTNTIEFQSLTISFKGLIEENSSKLLDKLGINEQLKFRMVTSVLRGAWLNWTSFNRMTTTTR